MSDHPDEATDAEAGAEADPDVETPTDSDGGSPADAGGLAAVVAKAETETAIDVLRDAGVYDDDRSVAPCEGGVAIPLTGEPSPGVAERAGVREVRPVDLPARTRDLVDLLRARGWDEADLAAAPRSWAVLGTVILVAFEDGTPAAAREAIGEALLDLHGEADTVLAREGIDGPHREPSVAVVAGEGDTETVHAEHGTRYAMDLAEVMFSPGNAAERRRMGEVVEPDERVLDMFAGVGYFALPMARAGARVAAVERNPASFRYLVENARLNDVTDRLSPFLGDCRDVVEAQYGPDARESVPRVDRVVMGHFDAGEYLESALVALAPEGWLHVHATAPSAELPARPRDRVESAVEAAGRKLATAEVRSVKPYSEGVEHVVVDARVA